MSGGATRFERIVDLGCGNAPYYPAMLPLTDQYIGIDLIKMTRPPETGMSFRQGDALENLAPLEPGYGDLIVSVFAGHHIGMPRLMRCLGSAHRSGAEFLIVDPIELIHGRPNSNWVKSILVSIGVLLRARLNRGTYPFVKSCVREQLSFLLSRNGYSHSVEDTRNGLPAPFAEIETLARSAFGGETGALVEKVGALLIIASGPKILDWLGAPA